MSSFAPNNLARAATRVSPMHDLANLLTHSRVQPRKPVLECRNCGNPEIVAGKPCRYCAVVTGPKPDRAPWQCPKCKGGPRLDSRHDVLAGETVFLVRCHDEQRTARVTDREMEDHIEREDLALLIAGRIAEAIDRFSDSEVS